MKSMMREATIFMMRLNNLILITSDDEKSTEKKNI